MGRYKLYLAEIAIVLFLISGVLIPFAILVFWERGRYEDTEKRITKMEEQINIYDNLCTYSFFNHPKRIINVLTVLL